MKMASDWKTSNICVWPPINFPSDEDFDEYFTHMVNRKDIKGYTMLHLFLNGKPNISDKIRSENVTCLLSYGYDPCIADNKGNTPLHLACQKGNFECAKVLLEATNNSLINRCNKNGKSPLMIAVRSQNIELVEFLLDHGADTDIFDNAKGMALHTAAQTGNIKLFRLIQRATKLPTLQSNSILANQSKNVHKILLKIILNAIDTENPEFLKMILESGINFSGIKCSYFDEILDDPISYVLKHKMKGQICFDLLLTLIENGFSKNTRSTNKFDQSLDPLSILINHSDENLKEIKMRCLKLLLEHGANPDFRYDTDVISYNTKINCFWSGVPSPIELACGSDEDALLLLLQYSWETEPEDLLKMCVYTPWPYLDVMVPALLPLAPYYRADEKILPHLEGEPRKEILGPKVYPLTSYCRSVIRRQLHEETRSTPSLQFRRELFNLRLPKILLDYLSYKY